MDINANTDAGVRVFQPLPDNLSRTEQIDYTIDALVADTRFALLEIAKLREENHAMHATAAGCRQGSTNSGIACHALHSNYEHAEPAFF